MNASENRVIFLIPVLASALTLGCLAPPPNCVEPQTATGATTDSSGATTPVAATATAASPGDLSKPLVVWNGDDVNPTAKQWASCDTQPCTSTLEPAPKVGANGSIGLEFKAKGKGYVGFGWNWTSWYAAGATNLTGRKKLKFQLQILPASPEVAPQVDGLRVRLGCAKSDKCAKVVGSLAKYAPQAGDGKWHSVVIPLEDMKPEDKEIWDEASVWEFQIHNWAPTPREFVAHIDDITFE